MKFRKILLTLLSICVLVSCKKDDFEYVEGNTAPPDKTVESVIIENYVNKLYISVLGRQASDDEYNTGLTILNSGELNDSSREVLVDVVMANEEYYHNEFETIRNDLLNSSDTSDFTFWVKIFEANKLTTNDAYLLGLYDSEIDKLGLCQDIILDLQFGVIDFIEVQRRCCNNTIYDDINMGTENFVVSMYQNFLFRYPTIDELSEAIRMVDGYESIVFYELGRSKNDFLGIFLGSDEYFEGQVRTVYNRFLYREPTTFELNELRLDYKSNKDFKKLQKQILINNEYVGI